MLESFARSSVLHFTLRNGSNSNLKTSVYSNFLISQISESLLNLKLEQHHPHQLFAICWSGVSLGKQANGETWVLMPPSTVTTLPVIYDAPGIHMNATTLAISLAFAKRRNGMRSSMVRLTSIGICTCTVLNMNWVIVITFRIIVGCKRWFYSEGISSKKAAKCQTLSNAGVSVHPGAITFTRILSFAHSKARSLPNWLIAAEPLT